MLESPGGDPGTLALVGDEGSTAALLLSSPRIFKSPNFRGFLMVKLVKYWGEGV